MIALSILAGVALGIAALAALIYAVSFFVRSLAVLLPPAGRFLGTVTELRDNATAPTSVQMPTDAPGAVPWPTRRSYGVAPAPVDTTSETGFAAPPVEAGDRNIYDPEMWSMLEHANRPLASGSKLAEPPPGPPLVTER